MKGVEMLVENLNYGLKGDQSGCGLLNFLTPKRYQQAAVSLVQYPHSTPIVLTWETKSWEDTHDCQGNRCTECRMQLHD